jgi:hypothetical protein
MLVALMLPGKVRMDMSAGFKFADMLKPVIANSASTMHLMATIGWYQC